MLVNVVHEGCAAPTGAAIALYMTGNTDPGDLIKGGIAACLPVILKALNPNETAFGFTKKA